MSYKVPVSPPRPKLLCRSPWGSQPGFLLGTVELGWALPLPWTCPWGFTGATTATAQEELAHCQHMRDGE